MNERSKLLAEQAGAVFTDCHAASLLDDEIEKFAELIVQDNIQTLRSNGYDDAAQCLHDVHFGMDDHV